MYLVMHEVKDDFGNAMMRRRGRPTKKIDTAINSANRCKRAWVQEYPGGKVVYQNFIRGLLEGK